MLGISNYAPTKTKLIRKFKKNYDWNFHRQHRKSLPFLIKVSSSFKNEKSSHEGPLSSEILQTTGCRSSAPSWGPNDTNIHKLNQKLSGNSISFDETITTTTMTIPMFNVIKNIIWTVVDDPPEVYSVSADALLYGNDGKNKIKVTWIQSRSFNQLICFTQFRFFFAEWISRY